MLIMVSFICEQEEVICEIFKFCRILRKNCVIRQQQETYTLVYKQWAGSVYSRNVYCVDLLYIYIIGRLAGDEGDYNTF